MKSLDEYIKESISHCVDEIENDDKKTGKNHWILQGKIQAYEDILDHMTFIVSRFNSVVPPHTFKITDAFAFYELQDEYDD